MKRERGRLPSRYRSESEAIWQTRCKRLMTSRKGAEAQSY